MVKLKLGLLILKNKINKFYLHNFNSENEIVGNKSIEFIDYKSSENYYVLLFDCSKNVIIYGIELEKKEKTLHIKSIDSTGEYKEGNDLIKYLLVALMKYFLPDEISIFSRHQPYFLFNKRKKFFSENDLCEFWLKIMRIFQCINNFSYSIYKNKFTNKIILFSDRPETKIAKLIINSRKNYANKIIYMGSKSDFLTLLENNKDFQKGNIITVKKKISKKNQLYCTDHDMIEKILFQLIKNFKIFSGDFLFLKKFDFSMKGNIYASSNKIIDVFFNKIMKFSIEIYYVKR